jgi:hypothetical protein
MASNRLELAVHTLLTTIRLAARNGDTDTSHASGSEQDEQWDLMGEEGHLRIQKLRKAGRSKGRILGSWSWDG